MGWYRSGAGSGAAIVFALFLGAHGTEAAAQAPADPAARVSKSVRGTLETIDKSLNGVVVKTDTGERLAWKFDAAVIAEAVRFKPGDPVIVIYRQLASNEKRVTALAFPGTASTPTYINKTGSRVSLRSAPAVGGVCGGLDAGPVSESTIPLGGRAEVLEACWCCAPTGETCNPGTKSGGGQAILITCF
jgi:hypothetical protein